MSSLDWQANIRGELGNKKIQDMRKMLDYSKTTFDERLEVVINILNEYDNFLNIYFFKKNEHSKKYFFSGHNLSSSQSLSEQNVVCNNISILGSYLLNSRDIDKLYDTQEYIFYTDEEEFNKYHQKVVSSTSKSEEEVIHFLLRQGKNYNIVGRLEVNKNDLKENSRKGEILRDYNKFKEELRKCLIDLKNGTKTSSIDIPLYQAKRIMSTINDDMTMVKESYSRNVYFDGLKSDNSIDWSFLDMTNIEHVKALLYINKGNKLIPDDDLSLIVYDLNKRLKDLLDIGILKHEDLKLINLLRQEKSYSKYEISRIMGYSQSVLSKRINKIAKRVSKSYSVNN